MFKELFSQRWRWATLLVLVGMVFLAQLGFWQLERLAQRRAENTRIAAQLAEPPIQLHGSGGWTTASELYDRRVVAQGEFDLPRQVGVKNQFWQGQVGIRLLTPLILTPTVATGRGVAVLVDRGWIPYDRSAPSYWADYGAPVQATVVGFGQPSQTVRGQSVPAATAQQEWFRADVAAIAAQMPYDLLPFYILQSPAAEETQALPYRQDPEFDLSEGSHLSYAWQWFTFSLMFGVGYLYYVKQHGDRAQPASYGEPTGGAAAEPDPTNRPSHA